MLNKEKHQLIMGRILKDIFTDTSLAPLLGFKGGTCAYFFYQLPRFSVDLDFDLLTPQDAEAKKVYESIGNTLKNYGKIRTSYIKKNILFFLLSYGEADHNIKVEVSLRTRIPELIEHFELRGYLGISMMIGKKPYLFASKLTALTTRNETAMRDIYDIWHFAKNNWEIDIGIIEIRTGKSLKKHLSDCISLIQKVKDNQILQGLGELLGEKEKAWVKNHLREEVVFLLKNYQSVLK